MQNILHKKSKINEKVCKWFSQDTRLLSQSTLCIYRSYIYFRYDHLKFYQTEKSRTYTFCKKNMTIRLAIWLGLACIEMARFVIEVSERIHFFFCRNHIKNKKKNKSNIFPYIHCIVEDIWYNHTI